MLSSQWRRRLSAAGLGGSRIELGFYGEGCEQPEDTKAVPIALCNSLQIFKYCPVGSSGANRTRLLCRVENFEEVDEETRNRERLGKRRGEEAKRGFWQMNRGWDLGQGRTREKSLRMGTAKTLLNIGMPNV